MGIEDTDLQPIKDDGKVETAMKGAGLFFFVLLLIELPVSLAISIVQDQFDAQYATLIYRYRDIRSLLFFCHC